MIRVRFFVFMILSLTPGDPAVIALGSDATEEQLELFREQNGLNAPIIIQYLNYMKAAVTGDLGTSYITRQSVSEMISVRAPTTLTLAFSSMILTVIISLPLGVIMAVKQNSVFDNIMRVITIIFTSMPQFWMALMMILLFSVTLRWLPPNGFDSFKAAIMPIVCLAFGGITMCARTGRSSMLEVIHQDYIRTARAKGLRYKYIIRRHALKNSMLPMITVYGRIVATCFGGAVVLETVFGINGLGQMMTAAVRQKDAPAILGSIIISACIITIVNLPTDLAYAFIDPRIKSKYIRRMKEHKVVSWEMENKKRGIKSVLYG
jgi:peptide/nickel transport system permease protein